MIQKMEYKNMDDAVSAISGIIGGILAINLAGITWDSVLLNFGHLLWVGIIAFFSGAMGVLGKHLIGKMIKKFSKK